MIRDYHFHLYFTETDRASAAALRERLAQQRAFVVKVGLLREAPFGPHPVGQFLATVPVADLEAAVRWFMFHHGEHSVLIHPNSGQDILDHTARALWLGRQLALDHSKPRCGRGRRRLQPEGSSLRAAAVLRGEPAVPAGFDRVLPLNGRAGSPADRVLPLNRSSNASSSGSVWQTGMMLADTQQAQALVAIGGDDPLTVGATGIEPAATKPAIERYERHVEFRSRVQRAPVVRVVRRRSLGPARDETVTMEDRPDVAVIEGVSLGRRHPALRVELLCDPLGGVARATWLMDPREQPVMTFEQREPRDGSSEACLRLAPAGPVDHGVDELALRLWSAEPCSAVLLADEQDVVDKIAYVAANPVAAGLVQKPEDWPGLSLWQEGVVDVQRPGAYSHENGASPERLVLRRKLWFAIDVKVAEAHRKVRAAGRAFLGRAGVLAQSFVKRASSFEPKRALVPTLAARDPAARRVLLGIQRAFRVAYRVALSEWRDGARAVVFPFGTWWMRVHHAAVTEPEPKTG